MVISEDKRNHKEHIDGYGEFQSYDHYLFVKCAGCDNISLVNYYSDDSDPEGTTLVYPARQLRQKPKWFNKMIWGKFSGNHNIYEYLTEIYKSLDNDNYRLCAMGIRSLVEHILINKVSDNGRFNENLKLFLEKGHVTNLQHATLEKVIEIGHAVTHRGYSPERHSIESMLDVAEHLIDGLYINRDELDVIVNNVPKRI